MAGTEWAQSVIYHIRHKKLMNQLKMDKSLGEKGGCLTLNAISAISAPTFSVRHKYYE
ncbi:MAG: hypothetical protein ACRCT7_10440 [Shewanella sp.]